MTYDLDEQRDENMVSKSNSTKRLRPNDHGQNLAPSTLVGKNAPVRSKKNESRKPPSKLTVQ